MTKQKRSPVQLNGKGTAATHKPPLTIITTRYGNVIARRPRPKVQPSISTIFYSNIIPLRQINIRSHPTNLIRAVALPQRILNSRPANPQKALFIAGGLMCPAINLCVNEPIKKVQRVSRAQQTGPGTRTRMNRGEATQAFVFPCEPTRQSWDGFWKVNVKWIHLQNAQIAVVKWNGTFRVSNSEMYLLIK